MDRARFEELVGEAVAGLPKFFKERLENVAIIVEDWPGPEVQGRFRGRVLGLYHGVPRPQRSVWAQYPSPDMIYIYRKNIEAICRTEEEIKAQVRETVIHEIGHYFGLTDERIRELQQE
ncbi:MAG: metallopeptidase family protein [Candidatus Bipolaricaulia bacterium]